MPGSSPIVLAIETATPACSVALTAGGITYQQNAIGNNIHSQLVLSMVQQLLQDANLQPQQIAAVAVGQGPGSFTGLRIGIGVAQGLAYGANCPMIGVSSLDALAQQATQEGTIIAGIDARMSEIYWCEYKKTVGELNRQCKLRVSAPIEIDASNPAFLVGNAWAEYWPDLNQNLRDTSEHLIRIQYPAATAILELALAKFAVQDWVSAIDFRPEYVRNDVAHKAAIVK